MTPRTTAYVIYINAFIVGSALMGFEMLGSRYLFPYFGGGIGTWAGLISTVLIALTLGYLAGGALVDRNPSSSVIAIAVALAGVYLAIIPPVADPVIAGILDVLGDGPIAILCASAVLCLVPLTLLGMYSPVAVRLIVRSTEEVGRVAGLVYGISTFGNVFGILFTTFYLIPEMGSRSITYLFGAVLLASAAMLYAVRRR
jgi:predicted membrane-bound spermidine synthase